FSGATDRRDPAPRRAGAPEPRPGARSRRAARSGGGTLFLGRNALAGDRGGAPPPAAPTAALVPAPRADRRHRGGGDPRRRRRRDGVATRPSGPPRRAWRPARPRSD